MLIIVSDLHLNDGTTSATLPHGAFSLLAERLRDMAVAASWRADGSYRPIERLDVILLGDVLDPIRSTRWNTRPGLRPWDNPHSPEMVDQIARITSDILARNEESLGVLRLLASERGVTVPPMLRAARPAIGPEGQPVRVSIHYMVGNHDWFYHLPGADYDAIRGMVVEHLGLANDPERPFPHDPGESDELLQTMRRHKVIARHGDVFDPLWFEGDRDASSLGDAILIELVNRFAAEVRASLGSELPQPALLALGEIDHIRPLWMIPVWIDGLLDRTCPAPATRKRVKTVWDRLADELLAGDFVCQRDARGPRELVDGLARALRFSKRPSSGWASQTAEWMSKLRGASGDSYASHAIMEPDFRNRRARHVVLGHTHAAEIVPLDASYAEGYVLDQVYFNAGTWRRVYRPTRLAPAEHEFVASDVMTYLAFYQGDERKGRPYETWTGALGHAPPETTTHRIDTGRATHVASHPLSTPSLSPHAPHFAALPGKAAGVSARRRS